MASTSDGPPTHVPARSSPPSLTTPACNHPGPPAYTQMPAHAGNATRTPPASSPARGSASYGPAGTTPPPTTLTTTPPPNASKPADLTQRTQTLCGPRGLPPGQMARARTPLIGAVVSSARESARLERFPETAVVGWGGVFSVKTWHRRHGHRAARPPVGARRILGRAGKRAGLGLVKPLPSATLSLLWCFHPRRL